MLDNTIAISTPPHVKSRRTTRGIMGDVLIALAPAAIMGMVFFGWQALIIELVAVISCVATEFCYYFIANGGFAQKCKNAKEVCQNWLHQFDLTSVVTGLILALILPTTDVWWLVACEVIIGSIFAIAVGKMFFGGTGKNLVNPASVARVFMFLSFSLTAYTAANIGPIMESSEIFSGATSLGGLLANSSAGYEEPTRIMSNLDLFLGTGVAGCIGETSKLAILVGFIYLCVRKVIKWWQPLLFLAIFGFVSVLTLGGLYKTYTFDFGLFLPSILSGGVAFAAVFMFTDYTTSPRGVWGQLLYYGVSAILLALLRFLTGIEVASFVIILMNLFVPLMDRYLISKPFGYKKEITEKEGE